MRESTATRRNSLIRNTLLGGLLVACLLTAFELGKLYGVQTSGGGQASGAPEVGGESAPQHLWRSVSTAASSVVKQDPHTTPYYRPGATRFDGAVSKKAVCLNTCKKARDGVCDDGRPKPGTQEDGKPRKVLCDLGTDCEDCGAWTPSGHAPWISGSSPGPVAQLLADGVEVNVRRSTTQPAPYLAYTDPDADVDVSFHMERAGVVEAGITTIFQKIFVEKCKPAQPGGKPGLFVDVGANFGWFSVLAAAMGCRVIAFEPVPRFHAFFEYSVHLNGFAKLVDMRGNVVSHISGSTLKMVMPSHGIWGTAGIDGLNIDRAITKSVNKEIHVPSQKLDDLIHDNVLLLKVDVEGWEWSVMQGAAKLMKKYNVENVIMEYSPGVPERSFRAKEIKATVQMLVNLVDGGFRIAQLGDTTKHLSGSLDAPLPAFEEVTAHNLQYDLVDAELFARSQLGCPVPPALQKYSSWSRCQALPEDPNPRSLRSVIGHNTNLWMAKKGTSLMNLKGTVGILPLDAPASQFFVNYDKPKVFGMGSRECKDLPASVQVRHRCECKDKEVCGEEHDAMVKVLSTTGVPSNYVLSPSGTLVSGVGDVADVMKELGSAAAIGQPYRPGAVQGMLA